MVNKRVPDWLNSSLWASNPSQDERLIRYAAACSDEAPEPDVPAQDPIQEPPAVATVEEHPARGDDPEGPEHVDSSSASVPPEEISRQAQLLAELSKKVVNMKELRRLARQGIPDGAGIRSAVWKLLLGYLPTNRELWTSELAKKRSQYALFKEELLVNPSEIARRMEKCDVIAIDEAKSDRSPLPRSEIIHGEHPLSLGKTSVWNQFFQDSEIIEQIDRDVKRTHPDMNFFSGETPFAKANQEALRRILIVFAKLNPGIRYVQGMNEVLAPLFYVFRNDPVEENAHEERVITWCYGKPLSILAADLSLQGSLEAVHEIRAGLHASSSAGPCTSEPFAIVLKNEDDLSGAAAEADTFFCFVELLSGFQDHFCQQLDNSVVGIRSTITKLSQLLKEHDEELWRHLEITTKINPQFYAFRWITLLLTQEFNFADSLHIWDTLLSDPEGPQETLLRIGCAMLILIRRRLLAGDFTSNLKLLQNYPSTNISHLLYVADKLRVSPTS